MSTKQEKEETTAVSSGVESTHNAILDTTDEDIESIKPPLKRSSSIFSISDLPPLPPPNESDYIGFIYDNRHFSMIRLLHMADFITCLNGFLGFYSIISCLRFTSTGKSHYVQRAHFFIFLGMIFDFLDGRVARIRNKSSLMGQELDSLADLVSFCVAPALIAFLLGLDTTVDVLILLFFVLCGLTRLARYNVTVNNIPKDKKGKIKFFEGLPVPTSLVLVGFMAWFVYKDYYASKLGLPFGVFFANSFIEVHLLSFAFFLHGCGLISKSLHVPKP